MGVTGPAVEVTHHRNGRGVRRPDGEVGALDAIGHVGARPEDVMGVVERPLAEEVDGGGVEEGDIVPESMLGHSRGRFGGAGEAA